MGRAQSNTETPTAKKIIKPPIVGVSFLPLCNWASWPTSAAPRKDCFSLRCNRRRINQGPSARPSTIAVAPAIIILSVKNWNSRSGPNRCSNS